MNDNKEYNGHKNRKYWNVSLWFNNDYDLYTEAVSLIETYGLATAVKYMTRNLDGKQTPDGHLYSFGAIEAAMEDLV